MRSMGGVFVAVDCWGCERLIYQINELRKAMSGHG
jgi:hypothetical protein